MEDVWLAKDQREGLRSAQGLKCYTLYFKLIKLFHKLLLLLEPSADNIQMRSLQS